MDLSILARVGDGQPVHDFQKCGQRIPGAFSQKACDNLEHDEAVPSMSLDPSWRPLEDDLTLFNEKTWLAGMILSAVAYGVVLTLFVLSFIQLVRTTNKSNLKTKIPLIIYISLIFLFGTLIVGAGARFTQLSFIDGRLIPGGPSAFEQVEFSIPVDEIANVSYVLATWLADGMVVWRCMIIYRSCRYPSWLVMGIPFLAYLASVSIGILWLIQISTLNPWSATTLNFTAPYFWLSLALNITMTVAITGRLLVYRWRITSVLGGKHGSQYTSVAAMIVESAFLIFRFCLTFLEFLLHSLIQSRTHSSKCLGKYKSLLPS
ncbi:hypothetical protein B0H34DRAFT_691776 [Crassisporium funariophilum]|nr:hypothetical protein B0H34DRAFT_691776 [Crassisporium funariophilum]